MAQAKYEILIPKHDTLGMPVVALAPHAMAYLTSAIHTETAHIEPRQVSVHGAMAPFDVLVFTGEDLPQMDSTAKQVAAYVGDAANQDSVLVTKHGKQGIQVWPVKNSQHMPGQPSTLPASNPASPAM